MVYLQLSNERKTEWQRQYIFVDHRHKVILKPQYSMINIYKSQKEIHEIR